MNSISKLIIAVAVAVNLAGFALVCGVILQDRTQQQAKPIQLGIIVVTPAAVETGPVNLGTVVVTPSDADWRYAEAHGVQRPAMNTTVLGSIVVQPTAEQLAQLVDARLASNASATGPATAEDETSVSLIEALEAFSPGHYLDTDTPLRLLNALVFERTGG